MPSDVHGCALIAFFSFASCGFLQCLTIIPLCLRPCASPKALSLDAFLSTSIWLCASNIAHNMQTFFYTVPSITCCYISDLRSFVYCLISAPFSSLSQKFYRFQPGLNSSIKNISRILIFSNIPYPRTIVKWTKWSTIVAA